MTENTMPWYAFYDGVRPHLNYPEGSVYDLLEASAAKYENNISHEYYGTKCTYKEFLKKIEQCAKALTAYGVRSGECVSICMPNTPEAVIFFYAVNKIGAVANMIHPLSSAEEMKYYFTVSESVFLLAADFTQKKIASVWKETRLKKCVLVSVAESMSPAMKLGYYLTKGKNVRVTYSENMVSWKDFYFQKGGAAKAKAGEEAGRAANTTPVAERTAVVLYSGGTTGHPKGIELTNYNFNALAMQSFEACRCLAPKDKVLSIMPIFHGFGLGICIHTVQYFGGTSILLPQFQAKTFDKLLKKYRPNVIAGVPTLYEAMLKNKNLEGFSLSFLKCVISGGDSLSVSLKQKVDTFLQEHGATIQIREGYGLTECVTGSCLTPMNTYREGSIGIPYPDTYYKIVKTGTEEEVPAGEEGEIIISGPTVMKGYLKSPEETAKVLRRHDDGRIWLYTGDYGSMDEDGFVYFKQRIKRVIISSGYNIYPQYIENIIDSHEDVLYSCVIGIPHAYKGQVAKAFVVLKNGEPGDEEKKEEVRTYCQERLAKYSWPYAYEFRKELPKTLVGKIAYRQLEEEELQKTE